MCAARVPRYREMSEFDRGRLIGMIEVGTSVKEVARQLQRDPRTVRYWRARWEQENNANRKVGHENILYLRRELKGHLFLA